MGENLANWAGKKELLYSAVLADALDSLGHRNSALPPRIRPLAPHWKVFGRVVTLDVLPVAYEPAQPYQLELECIDGLTHDDVLVATTHGDTGSALWGELLSTACQARGVAGVILDGFTRDAEKILRMDFPVFAAGFSPLDSKGRLECVSHHRPIQIGECVIASSDWAFADLDGVVVVPQALADAAFTRAVAKISGENIVREELARGKSLRETFAKYGIL